ncbi:hypothetical protein Hdeb2414_s0004g00124831 [Helianthus debilis subsp. tardiflorus]
MWQPLFPAPFIICLFLLRFLLHSTPLFLPVIRIMTDPGIILFGKIGFPETAHTTSSLDRRENAVTEKGCLIDEKGMSENLGGDQMNVQPRIFDKPQGRKQ